MSEGFASELLREGLLSGVSALHVVAERALEQEDSTAARVRAAFNELGANVWDCEAPRDGGGAIAEEAIEEALERALDGAGQLQLLVVDGGSLFACAAAGDRPPEGERARAALRDCLESTWAITRAVVNRAFLLRARGGRVIYIAPPVRAGEHAVAARAGLENLARTLSIEWARFAITVVAIAPGAHTAAREVAALTAYLASPAGAYFSGCLLELSG